MDPYRDLVNRVVAQYPAGERAVGGNAFDAFLLPRSEEPLPSPTAMSASETARQRDVTRTQDLGALQLVIETFAAERGSYPDTGGGVQSLCVFRDLDVGCVLLQVASLPEDPLGDAMVNGYFYASDGESYAVYAQRESDRFPACEGDSEFLQQFESLLCVRGP